MKTAATSLLFASVLFLGISSVACGGATSGTDSPTTSSSGGNGGSSSGSGGVGQPGGPGSPPPTEPPTSPVHPTPGPDGWQAKASGCGDFTIYAGSQQQLKYLVINADKTKLGIAKVGDTVTIDLADDPRGTVVHLDRFSKPATEPPYCTDIIVDPSRPSEEPAFQGQITFTISAQGREDNYAVDVRIENVAVKGANGIEAIPTLVYTGINVGWFAG